MKRRRRALEQIKVSARVYPRRGNRTNATQLLNLLRDIAPVETQHRLRRVGGPADGGYLVPDDLKGISHCFSPGVGSRSEFENQLGKMGIHSFLADYSVDKPAVQSPHFTFDKKYIGAQPSDRHLTLQSWVEGYLPHHQHDLILQMDIEGSEYEVLQATSPALLNRFRIMVIEFHKMNELVELNFFTLFSTVFEKLRALFHIVHIHPNNCCGSLHYSGIEIPRVTEFTLLRKDRGQAIRSLTQPVNALDAPNIPAMKPLYLPSYWYTASPT